MAVGANCKPNAVVLREKLDDSLPSLPRPPHWISQLNGLDPELYLRTVLALVADHSFNRIDELLPWKLASSLQIHSAQAA